jgi:hypothetical protein
MNQESHIIETEVAKGEMKTKKETGSCGEPAEEQQRGCWRWLLLWWRWLLCYWRRTVSKMCSNITVSCPFTDFVLA